MEIPLDEQDARDKVGKGRLIQGLHANQGYKQLLKPFLAKMLEAADKKCHDIKLREDRGKYAIAEYNAVKSIVDFLCENVDNMKSSLEYLKEQNIDI